MGCVSSRRRDRGSTSTLASSRGSSTNTLGRSDGSEFSKQSEWRPYAESSCLFDNFLSMPPYDEPKTGIRKKEPCDCPHCRSVSANSRRRSQSQEPQRRSVSIEWPERSRRNSSERSQRNSSRPIRSRSKSADPQRPCTRSTCGSVNSYYRGRAYEQLVIPIVVVSDDECGTEREADSCSCGSRK